MHPRRRPPGSHHVSLADEESHASPKSSASYPRMTTSPVRTTFGLTFVLGQSLGQSAAIQTFTTSERSPRRLVKRVEPLEDGFGRELVDVVLVEDASEVVEQDDSEAGCPCRGIRYKRYSATSRPIRPLTASQVSDGEQRS